MKLLIVAQVVDKNHPVLGFFHGWIEEFAQNCEELHVICLQKGRYDLPDNVHVHSLGKEDGKGRITYIFRFYRYVWSLRKEYENVFVHMNQEYVLLGAVVWHFSNKKILFWRNHYAGSFLTRVAAFFVDIIYYTSAGSFTARFKNAQKMCIGIDTDQFISTGLRQKKTLLYVGRIASSKRIQSILDALILLKKRGVSYTLTIVGPCVSKEDKEYKLSLVRFVEKQMLPVTFKGPVSWDNLPSIYSAHAACINMSPPGMFDKVIGESLSCGTPVITTNADAADASAVTVLDTDGDLPLLLAEALFEIDEHNAQQGRAYVVEKHSLQNLVHNVLGFCSK